MRISDLLIMEEERTRAAAEIAKRAGLVRECESHSDIYIATVGTEDDYSAAYWLGNYLMNNDDPLIHCFNKNSRLMIDTVKQFVDECQMECNLCNGW